MTASSEDELTARFAELFGPAADGEIWTGDDAAQIKTSANTLVTVDSMTEGVDFDLGWARGTDVGFKLVAINVSDISAMGGRPTHAVATIQLGDDTHVDTVDEIASGIAEAATRWGLSVVGGDIGSGTDLSMTLTLLGESDGMPVLRSGAKPGDLICVTGSLGGASAGLILLQLGAVASEAVHAEIDSPSGAQGLALLAARQLRPEARVNEGLALRPHATAMIDISDGFALDLNRLCTASGVGCQLESSLVPIDPELEGAVQRVSSLPPPLELALTGGEDFELLFTCREAALDRVQEELDEIGTPVSVVGQISDGDRMIDGRPLEEWSRETWDHLRTR